jgi:hypothetical protein
MTAGAGNQQLGFDVAGEIDNIPHGMSDQDVCLELQPGFVRPSQARPECCAKFLPRCRHFCVCLK